MDTNPRTVLIAFGITAGFALHAATSLVIPRVDDPYMDDPLDLEAFTIRNGVVRIGLSYWRSMGGWTTYSNSLSFRWDGKALRLIGVDRKTLRRNSGETETLSVNFATGRVSVVTGTIGDDLDDKTRWHRVAAQKIETLETIGNGQVYAPTLPDKR